MDVKEFELSLLKELQTVDAWGSFVIGQLEGLAIRHEATGIIIRNPRVGLSTTPCGYRVFNALGELVLESNAIAEPVQRVREALARGAGEAQAKKARLWIQRFRGFGNG